MKNLLFVLVSSLVLLLAACESSPNAPTPDTGAAHDTVGVDVSVPDGQTVAPDANDEPDLCLPNCAGRECGDDGCGGTCGSCADNQVCSGGACVVDCEALCAGFECGDGESGGVCDCGSCEDDNVCTDDACDDKGACVFTNNTVACDDSDPCTADDTCADGLCTGTPVPCGCESDEDCARLEDGDLCNGTLVCVEEDSLAACALDPDTVIECPEPDDSDPDAPCLAPSCAPETGECSFVAANDGEPCSNEDLCTRDDSCSEGVCEDGEPVVCDDDNGCTDDRCDPAVGCVFAPNDATCDDGDPCTQNDACSDGDCVGVALDCDDDNPCTDDSCDPSSPGDCLHVNNTVACDDGDACTTGEACLEGTCAGGAAVTCDDGNPCTTMDHCADGDCVSDDVLDCDDENLCTDDSCDPLVAGGCVNTFNTVPCDDGDACTTGEACALGACAGGAPLSCDDDNLCTDDACDPDTGCVFTNNAVPCDDGDACTTNDACDAGTCAPGASLVCEDRNPCTDDTCDAETGCVFTNNTAPCDDYNDCTTDDVCADGVCAGTGSDECDDEDPCTRDICLGDGECDYEPLSDVACDDGDACTDDDLCVEGLCVGGERMPCDDRNACTADTCEDGACVFAPVDGACDDGNACTTGDFCSDGECLYEAALTCDDEEPCTTDTCDPASGCRFLERDGACDDGDACTTDDTCFEGTCQGGGTLACDDDNPCTDNACDPTTGCVYPNNSAPCSDGDACTTGDVCAGGTCTAGAGVVCDDENPCTDDACVPSTGCVFTNNSLPCDDLNDCTTDDVCAGGECAGTGSTECDDDNPCTRDVCLAEGGCSHEPLTGVSCTDGDPCTMGDQCEAGTCIAGDALVCDDENPCTDDRCEGGVCVVEDNTAACDDGNACTTGDHCEGGQCRTTGSLTCNDTNACTDDSCDPGSGCLYEDNDAPCSDGDACTTNDACVAGTCVGGAAPECDDDNLCTDDACDPDSGCVHTANSSPCDDGNACTSDDVCAERVCEGTTIICNDDEVCTQDTCDPATGCVFTPVDVPCSDGDACTGGDACVDGECVGTPLVCDDENVCTADACEAGVGCVHTPNTATCDDGDPCTVGDVCAERSCTGTNVPVDCDGAWDDWSACGRPNPRTCSGTRARTFHVDQPAACDGAPCEAVDGASETEDCLFSNGTTCDDEDPCTTNDVCDGEGGCAGTLAPVDCEGSWGDWSACERPDVLTCAGLHSRVFTVTVPAACGGESCPVDDGAEAEEACLVDAGTTCDDADPCTDDDDCDAEGVCAGTNVPVNCVGAWGAWSDCAWDEGQDFGCAGVRERTYTVESPATCGGSCPQEDGELDIEACAMPEGTACAENDGCVISACDVDAVCQDVSHDELCDDDISCTTDSCDPGEDFAQWGYPIRFVTVSSTIQVGCEETATPDVFQARRAFGRIDVTAPAVVKRLGAHANSAGTGAVRLSLFSGTAAGPKDLIACSEPVDVTGTTMAVASIQAELLAAGIYWVAVSPAGDASFPVGQILSLTSDVFTEVAAGLAGCDESTGCPDDATSFQNEGRALNVWLEGGGSLCLNEAVAPVDCVGSWSDEGDCVQVALSCEGAQSQVYTVTTEESCGGEVCPYADQETREVPCAMPAGTECQDNVGCTNNALCNAIGTCVGTGIPALCDDDDDCTDDTCVTGYRVALDGYPEALDGSTPAPVSCSSPAGGAATSSHVFGMVTVPMPVEVDQLGVQLAAGSTGNIRLSLYAGDATGPQTLEACSAPLPAAAGVVETPIPTTPVSQGLWWIGVSPADDEATDAVVLAGPVAGARSILADASGRCADWDGCAEPDSAAITQDVALNVWLSGTGIRLGCEHDSLAVDCVGAWNDDGACVQLAEGCVGEQTQTFAITVQDECGGEVCGFGDGDSRTIDCDVAVDTPCDDDQDCTTDDQCDGVGNCKGVSADAVDCVGSWVATGVCVQAADSCVGTVEETFEITVPQECGGELCEAQQDDLRFVHCDASGGTPCDDGSDCTGGGSCDGAGLCVAGSPDDALCNDDSDCTLDTCETGLHDERWGHDEQDGGLNMVPARCSESGAAVRYAYARIDLPVAVELTEVGAVPNTEYLGRTLGGVRFSLYAGDDSGPQTILGVLGDAETDGLQPLSVSFPPVSLAAGSYWVAVGPDGDGDSTFAIDVKTAPGHDVLVWSQETEGEDCADVVPATAPEFVPDLYLADQTLAVWLGGQTDGAHCVFTPQPVDCVGAWSAWTECATYVGAPSQCVGARHRVFAVTAPASCGGDSCDATHGETEDEACYVAQDDPCNDFDDCTTGDHCDGAGTCKSTPVTPTDCVGAWGSFSACAADAAGSCTGTETATFAVTTPAACGGEDCTADDGEQLTKPCDMPADTACQDGVGCTLGDLCDGDGLCLAGTPDDRACDDDDPCTSDLCVMDESSVSFGFPDGFDAEPTGFYGVVSCGVDDLLTAYPVRRTVFGQVEVPVDTILTGAGAHAFKKGSGAVRFSLYTDSAGEPDVLLACGSAVSVSGRSSVTSPLPATPVAAGVYWVKVASVGSAEFRVLSESMPGMRSGHGAIEYDTPCDDDPGCESAVGAFYVHANQALGVWLEGDADTTGCAHTPWFAPCDGAWSDWSDCSRLGDICTGTRVRSFSVTAAAQCGGYCAASDGDEQSEYCPMPEGTTCDDDVTCTADDTCNGSGGCEGSTPTDGLCNDDDPCTTDSCTWSGLGGAGAGTGGSDGGDDSRSASCSWNSLDDTGSTYRTLFRRVSIPHDGEVTWLGAHYDVGSTAAYARYGLYESGASGPGELLFQTPRFTPPSDTTSSMYLDPPQPVTAGEYWIGLAPVEGQGFVRIESRAEEGAASAYRATLVSGSCADHTALTDGYGAEVETDHAYAMHVSVARTVYECTTETLPPTDCVGDWGDWGECLPSPDTSQCKGVRTRYYEVSLPASCGGTACDYSDGEPDEQVCSLPETTLCDDGDPCTDGDHCLWGACAGSPAPVDCVGAWGDWGDCEPLPTDDCAGKEYRTYTVTTEASCDGDPCPTADGTEGSQSCFMPAGSACDDDEVCTGNDACNGTGGCAGAPLEFIPEPTGCDDLDPCTVDTCLPGDTALHYGFRSVSSSTTSRTVSCEQPGAQTTSEIVYGRLSVPEPTILTHLGARGNGSGSGPVRLALFTDDAGAVGSRIACANPTTPSAITGAAVATISDTPVAAGDYWVSVSIPAESDFHLWTIKDTSSYHMTRTVSIMGFTCSQVGVCPAAADTVVDDYDLAVWASSVLSGQDCVHVDSSSPACQ